MSEDQKPQGGANEKQNPADPAPKKTPDPAPKQKLPKKLILQSLYGFYDEAGQFFSWVEGQIVDDVEQIKLLIERKAPAVEHKED